MSSLQSQFVDPAPTNDDSNNPDYSKWKRMFQEGEASKQETLAALMKSGVPDSVVGVEAAAAADMTLTNPVGGKVRIVTFDLDNTLWKTGSTIQAANDALAAYLEERNFIVPRRIEKIMGDLFQADKLRYCPLATSKDDEKDESGLTAPVLLTQLRTDAISHVLQTENGMEPKEAVDEAEACFQVWTEARHAAILENLAPDVVETMETIRNLRHPHDNQPVLVGAITDGNADPRRVDVLAPYFDFIINAESVGVAKPDKRVYLQAVRHIVEAQFPQFSNELVGSNDDEAALEDSIGPYWCHVGDDFLKDIVAAKNMNMRTIWAIELVRDKLFEKAEVPPSSSSSNADEAMDVGEFMKKISAQKVITMGIGADDYLTASLTGEFVDAVAESFADIGRILSEWHNAVADEVVDAVPDDEVVDVKAPQRINGKSGGTVASPDTLLAAVANDSNEDGVSFIVARTFRIVRDDCRMDVPAPLRERENRSMKDVMGMAQLDKSSGVFAFPLEDVTAMKDKKKVLMIRVGGTDLQFSRDIFSSMSVQEVLSLSDENPLTLSLFMKDAADAPSFDLF